MAKPMPARLPPLWSAGAARVAASAGCPSHRRPVGLEQISTIAGVAALAFATVAIYRPDSPIMTSTAPGEGERATAASAAGLPASSTALDAEVMLGGYGGMSDTLRSTVTIRNAAGARGPTDMTVEDFDWQGQPFKSPIYYGLRAVAWQPASRFGGMIDFTHAKAIADASANASQNGTRNGQPVAPKARIGETFKHFEFSHGHNMVTLNGLVALLPTMFRLRPYVGVGGGVALPHTEIGLADEDVRTYEYQYAGLVGQAVAGVEVKLGRASLFFEYKFSYAPYQVPLSQVSSSNWLATDLWRQARAWLAGTPPPGGSLATTLRTHHAIAGVLINARPVAPAVNP